MPVLADAACADAVLPIAAPADALDTAPKKLRRVIDIETSEKARVLF